MGTATTAEAATTSAAGVAVRLGGGRYGIELSAIAEVVGVPPLTRVPGAPAWLAGVANWRGRVLPALDLRPLLAAGTEPGASARLVVLAVDGVEAGLLVDAVVGLITASEATPAPAPVTASPAAADLVVGVVDGPDGVVALLDVAAVLGLRHQIARRHGGRPGGG